MKWNYHKHTKKPICIPIQRLIRNHLRIVHKLCLQEEMGRYSKNVNFYKAETVNEGGKVGQKSQKRVNVVCEVPLILNVNYKNQYTVVNNMGRKS